MKLFILFAALLAGCGSSTDFVVTGKHMVVTGKIKPGAKIDAAQARQLIEMQVNALEFK
jgi:uncharacterized protein YcfL